MSPCCAVVVGLTVVSPPFFPAPSPVSPAPPYGVQETSHTSTAAAAPTVTSRKGEGRGLGADVLGE